MLSGCLLMYDIALNNWHQVQSAKNDGIYCYFSLWNTLRALNRVQHCSLNIRTALKKKVYSQARFNRERFFRRRTFIFSLLKWGVGRFSATGYLQDLKIEITVDWLYMTGTCAWHAQLNLWNFLFRGRKQPMLTAINTACLPSGQCVSVRHGNTIITHVWGITGGQPLLLSCPIRVGIHAFLSAMDLHALGSDAIGSTLYKRQILLCSRCNLGPCISPGKWGGGHYSREWRAWLHT